MRDIFRHGGGGNCDKRNHDEHANDGGKRYAHAWDEERLHRKLGHRDVWFDHRDTEKYGGRDEAFVAHASRFRHEREDDGRDDLATDEGRMVIRAMSPKPTSADREPRQPRQHSDRKPQPRDGYEPEERVGL